MVKPLTKIGKLKLTSTILPEVKSFCSCCRQERVGWELTWPLLTLCKKMFLLFNLNFKCLFYYLIMLPKFRIILDSDWNPQMDLQAMVSLTKFLLFVFFFNNVFKLLCLNSLGSCSSNWANETSSRLPVHYGKYY